MAKLPERPLKKQMIHYTIFSATRQGEWVNNLQFSKINISKNKSRLYSRPLNYVDDSVMLLSFRGSFFVGHPSLFRHFDLEELFGCQACFGD